MIDEANEVRLESAINDFIVELEKNEIMNGEKMKGKTIEKIWVDESDFQTIIIQFRALALIIKNNRQRSLRDTGTYWSLTPYGDEIITKLRAIKRGKSDLKE
ncbi:hypothetical protein [Paenibacillus agaridevorans]|uniref:hypothetical protein n=1 Tax=Paenibacillus agaridevorans TaxID=171404 RepID=UPI001BE3F0B0|nr:hypothetical protein [Paenibacillus agaridevorans]